MPPSAQVLDLSEAPVQATVEPLKPRKKRKISNVAAAAVSAVGGFFNVYGDDVSMPQLPQSSSAAQP